MARGEETSYTFVSDEQPPHRAERAIENLAVLLQAALSDPHPWPLAAELDAARAYLALAQLRYGDRLVLDWQSDCPEAILTKRIPRWCLVPLIENAVTHGVARQIAAAGGTVQQVQDAGWHWVAITLPLDASNGG